MLGKNIKEQIMARAKEKNLSIQALEEKAGLNKNVSNIVRNKSLNPQIKTLVAIAKVLDCTVNDLIADPQNTKLQIQKRQKELEDCEFTETLFQEIVQKIIDRLQAKKIHVTLNQVMVALKEAYILFFTKKNKKVDTELIEWLIDKNNNQ